MIELDVALTVAPSIKFRAIVEGVELSDRASEVLAFIVVFQKDKSYAPSIRQIAAQCCNNSTAQAYSCVQSLLGKGVISRVAITPSGVGTTRSIQVLKPVKLEVVNG